MSFVDRHLYAYIRGREGNHEREECKNAMSADDWEASPSWHFDCAGVEVYHPSAVPHNDEMSLLCRHTLLGFVRG